MDMNIKPNRPAKISFLLFINLFFLVSVANAQKVYELNEIKQIPYINNSDMKTIAYSLFELYKTEINSIEKLSNSNSGEDMIRCYVLISGDLIRKNDSLMGENYSSIHKVDLEKNNMIFFNLIFDENGNIDFSDNLNIISCRTDNRGDFVRNGAISLNLSLPDSIFNKLKDIKLARVAAIDINSLNDELKPVKVKIPLRISFYERPSDSRQGKVMKKGENIAYQFKFIRDDEEKEEIINIVEKKTNLLEYKKGIFDFELKKRNFEYYITFCLNWQMTYSTQPTELKTTFFELESFTGEGKK